MRRSEHDPNKWFADHGPIAPNIPLPQGSHIWITREGLHAIRCFGAKWFRNNSSLKKGLLTIATAKSWAVEGFGRLIAEVKSAQHAYKATDDCIPDL